MDTINTIKNSFEKLDANEFLDHDSRVYHKFDILRHFARDILKLADNIEETSISYSHKIERKEKIVNQQFK